MATKRTESWLAVIGGVLLVAFVLGAAFLPLPHSFLLRFVDFLVLLAGVGLISPRLRRFTRNH